MDDASKGQRIRDFFTIEAKAMSENYKIIETLLPNSRTKGAAHRGEEGRYIEAILRTFLNKHLPQNLRAVSGFILCPSTKTDVQNLDRVKDQLDRHSTQLDIMIYDVDAYPVFERFEEFYIVPPEGVLGIISVKKTLYNRDLAPEFLALKGAAQLCHQDNRRGPATFIFAFSAQEKNLSKLNKLIFNSIEKSYEGDNFDFMVNEVSVLNLTCVFKNRPGHGIGGNARYVGVDCRTEEHIPIQRILQTIFSVYYDKTRGGQRARPGFVSFRQKTFANSPELGQVTASG
jgi:hypothetical protein